MTQDDRSTALSRCLRHTPAALLGMVVGLVLGSVVFDNGPGLEPAAVVLGCSGALVGALLAGSRTPSR